MTVIKRFNNAFGTTTDSPLGSTATTMNSQELPRLGVVDSANNEIARLTLDPERLDGAPEIVHVTDYDGTATSATIERGKEGTTAREHASGTTWEHGPTVEDFADRAARVYLVSSADQTIATSTWTRAALDTVTADPEGLFDSANSQIVLDKAGWWIVSASTRWQTSTNGDRRQVAITQNGDRVARGTDVPGTIPEGNVIDLVLAAAGDTIESQVWQDSGGDLDLMGNSQGTWLSVAYLGSA